MLLLLNAVLTHSWWSHNRTCNVYSILLQCVSTPISRILDMNLCPNWHGMVLYGSAQRRLLWHLRAISVIIPFFIQALRIRLWRTGKGSSSSLQQAGFCWRNFIFMVSKSRDLSKSVLPLENSENCTIKHHRLYTPLEKKTSSKVG